MNLPAVRCCKKSTPVGVYQQQNAIHFTFFKLISVICARPRKNEQTSMDQVCLVFLFSAVASWLTRSTPESSVPSLSPGRKHCVLGQAPLVTLTARVFTQVYKQVPANLMRAVALGWTSIPSSGEQVYCQSLHSSLYLHTFCSGNIQWSKCYYFSHFTCFIFTFTKPGHNRLMKTYCTLGN